MSDANLSILPAQSRDPVTAALRRLLDETDRTIAAADRARQARIELARLLADNTEQSEGDCDA